ncbi:MAG: class I SAM-dependent methyltransferase [Actinobacteria bacterium]|jgi:SAM-dependent methyltransferase|nr:class I SAM-dependent methyltransferase [Actinomycetota bacterium]
MDDMNLTEQTAAHFAVEFTSIADDDRDLGPLEMHAYLFAQRTGIDPGLWAEAAANPQPTVPGTTPDLSWLHGKRVLDAGCGPGRFTVVAAQVAQSVVALDIGDHLERARTRCERYALDNVEFVRGSVLDPPLEEASFDFVFSIGVLHHTPDPRGGVHALSRLLKPGGTLAVAVYPPAYWPPGIRGVVARAIHRRVSRMSPEASLRLCRRYLYPLGRLQMRLARRRWTKLLGAPLFLVNVPRHDPPEVMLGTIHDYYGPPIITTHTFEELEGWLAEAGLDVERLPVPTSARGKRPAEAVGGE